MRGNRNPLCDKRQSLRACAAGLVGATVVASAQRGLNVLKPLGDVILLAGPTASGKSALALELAERSAGVVINADALQVYRDLRVLTARPSVADEARVPHRLYGHVPASERYSVGRWLGEVAAALAEARRAGWLPIVVGGTGLYFKALTEGLANVPAIPSAIREKWRAALAEEGPAALYRRLAELDPEGAGAIRSSDPARIVRALEVIDATGTPLAEWQRTSAAPLVDRSARRFVIEIDRALLLERIGRRLEAMIGQGALLEVEALVRQRLDPAMPIMKAVGVREFTAHIEGRASLEEALAEVKRATARYAKRQMTWLRNQMADWERLDAGNIRKVVEALAQQTKKMH